MSQQINLFNPIFRKQQKIFSALAMLQALGLILAGAVAVAGYAAYQASYLRRGTEQAAAQLAAAQAQLAKITAEYGRPEKSKELEQELKKAEADAGALEQTLAVLKKGDFGNTKGYSDYLAAFARQSSEGIWLTGFTLAGAGDDIDLHGRALRADLVPAYIGALRREPVLQGKSFARLEMKLRQLDAGGKDRNQPKQPVEILEFSLQSQAALKDAEGAKVK